MEVKWKQINKFVIRNFIVRYVQGVHKVSERLVSERLEKAMQKFPFFFRGIQYVP